MAGPEMLTADDVPAFGPKMSALSPKRRALVMACSTTMPPEGNGSARVRCTARRLRIADEFCEEFGRYSWTNCSRGRGAGVDCRALASHHANNPTRGDPRIEGFDP